MIPQPAVLKKGLEFGNEKQIKAIKLHAKVGEEENRALLNKTGVKTSFFKDDKLLFETVFRNKNVAENLSIEMINLEDKAWTHDEIKLKPVRRAD